MPRSWTKNYYHIVFSTKRREQTVSPEIEARLYEQEVIELHRLHDMEFVAEDVLD